MAGFEGADHRNRHGLLLDLAASTGHAHQYRGDYRRARAVGLGTVRETVGWRITEHAAGHDFSRAIAFAREAQRQGVEIVWTLLHYGFPCDVDPFDARVVERFARFASAAARALKPFIARDAWFNPVNEISFTCWLLTEGQTGAPWTGASAGRARWLKQNLARAAVHGAAAVRDVLPDARFLHIDPVIHAVPQDDDPASAVEAAGQIRAQWDAWDLVCDPAFEPSIARDDRVHLIGINHYHSSQWMVPSRKPLRWHLRDPRRRPLADLCGEACARYRLPFILAETSHVGAGRADWFRDVAAQVDVMRARDLPLHGACVYPFVDRPDWDRPAQWHRSGLWDAVPRAHPRGPRRLPNRPYAAALLAAQRRLPQPGVPAARARGSSMDALIVFSHLRWDSVWQRPQQLCTRFAARFRVLFVEEPCFEQGPPRMELSNVGENVTVLRPHTAIQAPGFHDEQLPALRPLLRATLQDLAIDRYGVYTFTPMALPLMQDLAPEAIAYDCMDELSAFKFAPRQLPQRESALLRIANVVFTGGPSLYRSKRAQHDHVHCFPSSVDAPHFASARRAADVHPDVACLPRPRLGFYGVIDERLDLELVAAVATARPRWQFIYAGPVVKIDPATLPRAENIHWLPQQAYATLPALLAGWDLCLLPFARNEHTRFISPTKTLEYLAADKPVVSTPIVDVVELYGSVVHFGDEPDAFIDACERLLRESADEREQRIATTRALVLRTSWDATAQAMTDLLEQAAGSGLREEAKALLAGPPATLPDSATRARAGSKR